MPAVGSLCDSYVLEFLDVPEDYKELDLRKSIIANLKQFILEFGKDFTFMGEEYRVQVGNTEPEHLGQLNFYLEAFDRDVKKENENPSVGLILCTSKDDTVAEYAMSRSLSPTMVADYTLKLPDKKLLTAKLREITELVDSEN